jgi:anti-sigma B factor antagonist
MAMTSDDLTPFSADAASTGSLDGLEIEVQHPLSEVVLLALKGEVDMWTSLQLMDSIIEAFHEHPALIVVDLDDVRFMDAAGLGVLAEGARHIEDGRVRFAVVCPSNHRLTRLLQLAGLERALNVYESADDALAPWLDSEAGEVPASV